MGLASLSPTKAAEKGADLHLRHPATGELLFEKVRGTDVPVTVRLLGRDSKAVKDATKAAEKRRAKGAMTEADAVDIMAAAITGWSEGLCVKKPGDLPYSPENARALLTNPDTEWVAEQIGPFSMSRRSFVQQTD